ncbi:zinc-binding dehydrogenase [Microbacterium sp. NPDC090007]|uniref:zinc-dependent alcohol dehydrogenase n=1 Tax=Microbacterium sp. NPDC090007 TaxID=3364204 RepID=UPI003808AA70
MLAAVYTGERTFETTTVDATPVGADEVRIAVRYVGLCGTDLHIFHGHMDARVAIPAVVGHEMSGVVSEVGSAVSDWRPGDVVTVMPLKWDGTCPACLAGNSHICQNLKFVGIDTPGALQGEWVVPASLLVRVPDDMALAHAALVEPVAVAVHDVRRSELTAGQKAVVIGAGPIGVLIASVARAVGAEVAIVELDAGRRSFADDLGLTTIDPRAVDAASWVEEWTGGAGADVVFEVAGAASAVLSATSFAKVRGTIVVVAIHPEPRPIDLQRVFWRELRILGARVYQRTDFEEAVRLVAAGAVPTDALISGIVPLSSVQEAFETLEGGRALKLLVDVAGDRA